VARIFQRYSKQAFLFILLIGFFSCGIFDSKVDFNQGRTLQNEYFDTISFNYIRGKIVLPVIIQQDTFDFIFDSGAPTIVSEEIMERFSYPLLGADTIRDTHRNKKNRKIAVVQKISLGDIDFGNIPAIVSSFHKLPWSCFNVDGFIGSNLLRNSVVKINLDSRQLLVSNTLRPEMDYQKMQYVDINLDHQSSPYVKLTLGNNFKSNFLFDTGSDDFINLNQEEFQHIKSTLKIENLRDGYGSGTMGLFGPGKKGNTYKLRLDSLIFCDYRITNPSLKVTGADSKIGSKILEYGPVILNYAKRKLYFYSKENPVKYKEFSTSEFGFSPVLEDNQLKFGLIWENSVADSIGLKPGYRILRINEYDFTNSIEKSFCDIFMQRSLQSVDTLNIIFEKNKNKRNSIQLIRKE